ncbi:unnamed protein product, partial [Polarella glacialis]
MPAALFTFGFGPFGELGQSRPDGCKHVEAAAVLFPAGAPRDSVGELAVEAVSLGNDHSLAVVGSRVYRWGLVGAHGVPQGNGARSGSNGKAEMHSPEVVPTPTLLADLSITGRGRSRSPTSVAEEKRRVEPATVMCGGSNSFVLTSEGEVLLFGGLWPPGGDTNRLRHIWGTARAGPPSRVAQVAAGWRHCLLLTEAGRIFALGDDEHGQCAGAGSGTAAISFPSSHAAVGVAAGACHSIAWDRTGVAFAWGHGGSGRLGVGGSNHRSCPERVEALPESVCTVACGANFSLFVTDRGQRLWACGGNRYGQLGLGAGGKTRPEEVPVPADLPQSSGEEIVGLACGANHALCLTRRTVRASAGGPVGSERSTVWAWGACSSGQCGRVAGEVQAPLPEMRCRPARLLDFLAPSSHWAVAVAAGRSHSAVLTRSGPRAASHCLRRPAGFSTSPVVRPSSRASSRSAGRGSSGAPSPSLVSPPQVKVRGEEDIIDEFLFGLGTPYRSPAEPVAVSPRPRSQSPAAALVEMGEAALRCEEGEDFDFLGKSLDLHFEGDEAALLPLGASGAAQRFGAAALRRQEPEQRRLGNRLSTGGARLAARPNTARGARSSTPRSVAAVQPRGL